MRRTVRVCNVAHFQCVVSWIKPLVFIQCISRITLQKLFQALWSCSIILFVLVYDAKEWQNIKVQHSIQLWTRCAHVPYKHTTCIPRWNDVKTVVSTSFQREILVVCLWGCTFSNWLNLLFFILHIVSSLKWISLTHQKVKSLTVYHVYPRLKTVTKTFLEKVQHKSTTYWCTTDTLHFRVAL